MLLSEREIFNIPSVSPSLLCSEPIRKPLPQHLFLRIQPIGVLGGVGAFSRWMAPLTLWSSCRESICTFALSLPSILQTAWRTGLPCCSLLLLKILAQRLEFLFSCYLFLWRLLALLPVGFIADWRITLRFRFLVVSSSAPVRHIKLL